MINSNNKNPQVFTVPDAINLDLAIQKMQMDLASLTWLDKIFGRAWMHPVVNKKDTVVMQPMCYVGDSEYYNVMPNDALKSYCFFVSHDSREFEDYVPFDYTYYQKTKVDLITWVDLKAVDSSKVYVYTEELIAQQIENLSKNGCVEIERIYDDSVKKIFKGYDLKETKRDLLMYPCAAWRVEMNVRFELKCLNNG